MAERLSGPWFHIHAAPIKGSRERLCVGVEPSRSQAERTAARMTPQDVGCGRRRRWLVVTMATENEPCRNY